MIARNRESVTALSVAVIFFTTLSLVRHNPRLWPYLEVVAVLVILTSLADRAAHFSRALVGALTVLIVAHLAGGLLPSLADAPTFYETWLIPGALKFDQLVHGYGGLVLTLACARLAVGLLGQPKPHPWALPFVALLMAQGLGALNELIEFLFGLSNANLHAGGLENTGWDLAFNLAGSVIAFAWLAANPLEVDDEHERLVGTDHAAGALSSVGKVGRDR